MKKIKIFPKMFLQIFAIMATLIVLIHVLVFFIFPQSYLETRKREIYSKANEISRNIQGKDMKFVEQALDFYSKSSEIKAFVKGENSDGEIQIKKNINHDLNSDNNSLIIEEREIQLNSGEKIYVQFVSATDMKKDAINLSFKFLPFSLIVSIVFSVIISFIYAKLITNNINEIKDATGKMIMLDRDVRLKVTSMDEVGELKAQINNLYSTLLNLIDDLEVKNKDILKLEKLKYDFFRGASHELKTPLASLKIILENMKYNIGKYKNKEKYIDDCIVIVNGLTQNISQILTLSSFERFKNDEEIIIINDVLNDVLTKYSLLLNKKNISLNNYLKNETIYMGKTAIEMVLSNLISNAVKYSDENGVINIGVNDGWFYIENSYKEKDELDVNKIFEIHFDLNKENQNGLGLYIVRNILSNYGAKYKFVKNEIGVAFYIEIIEDENKLYD
ncbi:MAG: sensor histidine kinase [Candidatus Fimenecus sp.]